MSRVILRKTNRERRKLRVRKKIYGMGDQPRLSVFRSLKYVYGQIINDEEGKTLVSVSDATKELHKGKKKSEGAFETGKVLAERAKEKGIKSVVFDRNGYRYHGRIRKFLDGVREGGLNV